ncbi:hypothetical protein FGM00_05490 [Aggregatimonas sangjinii]|uniref:Uncharacterized protein n=1 Tax=Aggregatimonas sangjinii TaxID=2583587 RepID=A0A5B7SN72_9FLAO|nr:hypothetical protein [Aggregatimonas sangjinii]QCW99581.1 hypothetical protein FGM00_05490 [Aggregatimonas sangjinii]
MRALSTDMAFSVLVVRWKRDITPQDKTDSNFAMKNSTKNEANISKSEFYRQVVKTRNAPINTQSGISYGAFVSNYDSGI